VWLTRPVQLVGQPDEARVCVVSAVFLAARVFFVFERRRATSVRPDASESYFVHF
jgi:hypothetical protein